MAKQPDIKRILDIPIEISVRLGQTKLFINELMQLGQGSVIELDKLAGESADFYVENRLVAKGETVVVNEKFGLKIMEIVSPEERIKTLGLE